MADRIVFFQFGIGKFIRGYFDWILNTLKSDINVYAVQSTSDDRYKILQSNNCQYQVTLLNEKTKIDNIKVIKTIYPISEFDKIIQLFIETDPQFIVSNVTEKGFLDNSEHSYTNHLLKLLYERYKTSREPITIIPLELLQKNGEILKDRLISLISLNKNFEKDFTYWLDTCSFENTVVDCIVSAMDKNLNVFREDFYALYLEPKDTLKGLFNQSNLNIHFVDNTEKIFEIKLKVLNGIHTYLVCSAWLEGIQTTYEALQHNKYKRAVNELFFEEILPTIDYDKDFVVDFYQDTIKRFQNPRIQHKLSDIAQNSYEKFYFRIAKTIIDFQNKFKTPPRHLTEAFEGLKKLYPRIKSFDSYLESFANQI